MISAKVYVSPGGDIKEVQLPDESNVGDAIEAAGVNLAKEMDVRNNQSPAGISDLVKTGDFITVSIKMGGASAAA